MRYVVLFSGAWEVADSHNKYAVIKKCISVEDAREICDGLNSTDSNQ